MTTDDPSPDPLFSTFTDLFRALGFDDNDDPPSSAVVDYCYSYLSNDADVYVLGSGETDDGEYMDLGSAGVSMHSLVAPLTLTEFHEHLDELDRRIGRHLAIDSIPAPDEDEGGSEAIIAALAELFEVAPPAIVALLGRHWTALGNDLAGNYLHPQRFISWEDRVVVGLHPEQLTLAPQHRADRARQATEPTLLDWPETREPLELETFVAALRRAGDLPDGWSSVPDSTG